MSKITSAEDDLFGKDLLEEISNDNIDTEQSNEDEVEIDLDDLLSGALQIGDDDSKQSNNETSAKKHANKKHKSGYSDKRKRRRATVIESGENGDLITIDAERRSTPKTRKQNESEQQEIVDPFAEDISELLNSKNDGGEASISDIDDGDILGIGYEPSDTSDAHDVNAKILDSIIDDDDDAEVDEGNLLGKKYDSIDDFLSDGIVDNEDAQEQKHEENAPKKERRMRRNKKNGNQDDSDLDDNDYFNVNGIGIDGTAMGADRSDETHHSSVSPITEQSALVGLGRSHRRRLVTDDNDDVARRRTHTRALSKQEDDDSEVAAPEWVVSMRSKLMSSVAHAFLLEGNIRDYMVRNVTIKDGIVGVLDPDRDYYEIIACYDQSHGLYFYGADEEAGSGKTMADVYSIRFNRTVQAVTKRLGMSEESTKATLASIAEGKDVVKIFTIISEMFEMPGTGDHEAKILLFVDYADLLVPDASSSQMKPDERKLAITLSEIGRSQTADAVGNCLIFLTDDPTQLSSRIRSTSSRIETVNVPNPLIEQRRDFINNVLDVDDNVLSDGIQVFRHEGSITPEELAISTAGLSCIQIEDIVLRSLADDVPLDRQLVKERKNEIIKADYEGLLEIVDPSFGFERVGGLDALKRMFIEEVIKPIHANDLVAVPMGCLLMGNPGSGKALPLNSEIYVEREGLTRLIELKDIRLGDKVYGSNGETTDIIGIFPQGKLEAFQIEFEDGRSCICSPDHLWTVEYRCDDERIVVDMTTSDVLAAMQSNKRASYSIPSTPILSFKGKQADEFKKYVKKYEYAENTGAGVKIRRIYDLEYETEMLCIKVTALDGLFTIGRDAVITHNTMIAKAVAKEAGMNFVALNLNRIMDKWVGSSERNLDRALDCAMAMAPTIIFIDEIDEALPNRNDPNQSSVNKRINQRLLTFFSETEHRGQVMILAATNYPDKIDPAFKRAGRFDLRLPMFAPDEWDRMRIILIIAKARGYTLSKFESPDKMIKSPFIHLDKWVARGNAPVNEEFVGELKPYTYTLLDSDFSKVRDTATGKPIRQTVHLPGVMIDVLGKEEIPLWQFYRMCDVLFESFKGRDLDTSTGIAESDAQYYTRFHTYINQSEIIDMFATPGENDSVVLERIREIENRFKRYDKRYSPFARFTMYKTGAELDVVMNKAITLWRHWCKENPDKLAASIENGRIKNDHDIPFSILEQACQKTVSAVVGIKEMEDAALVNTSDRDYIPDAIYGKGDDNRPISYRQRQETLLNQRSTMLG